VVPGPVGQLQIKKRGWEVHRKRNISGRPVKWKKTRNFDKAGLAYARGDTGGGFQNAFQWVEYMKKGGEAHRPHLRNQGTLKKQGVPGVRVVKKVTPERSSKNSSPPIIVGGGGPRTGKNQRSPGVRWTKNARSYTGERLRPSWHLPGNQNRDKGKRDQGEGGLGRGGGGGLRNAGAAGVRQGGDG